MGKRKQTFEEAMEKLEDLVQELEKGNLSLDDSLATYEKGIGLIKFCHQVLGDTESKFMLLSDKKEDEIKEKI